MVDHIHDPEDLNAGYPDCAACQDLMAFEQTLAPEDLADLRVNSIVERYNYHYNSNPEKDQKFDSK